MNRKRRATSTSKKNKSIFYEKFEPTNDTPEVVSIK